MIIFTFMSHKHISFQKANKLLLHLSHVKGCQTHVLGRSIKFLDYSWNFNIPKLQVYQLWTIFNFEPYFLMTEEIFYFSLLYQNPCPNLKQDKTTPWSNYLKVNDYIIHIFEGWWLQLVIHVIQNSKVR